MQDAWDDAARYEGYVGRWSRLLAPRFLAWAGLPPGADVLDVGCGTGALSAACLAAGARRVHGIDASAAYVAEAARTLGPGGRATFAVGDAQRLQGLEGFDAAVSALVLNFLPEPAAAARGMHRAVHRGGLVAACVWDYGGKMELMRHFWDAAVALDPAAAALDEGPRFPLCEPKALAALFEGAGLRDVATAPIDQPTVFRDFEDYWTPFLGGQGPAPSYVKGLDEAGRAALRERLRARLPTQKDGCVHLVARAWAVQGTA